MLQLGHAAQYRPAGVASTGACGPGGVRYFSRPRGGRVSGGTAALEA